MELTQNNLQAQKELLPDIIQAAVNRLAKAP